MEKQGLIPHMLRHLPPPGVMAGFAVLMALVACNGWVSDDAYITFRYLDNFYAGNGLRWNTFERVQAYTHPLWMLLHIPLYGVWDNIFMVTITLSLACTAGAVALVLATFDRPAHVTIIGLLMPLALSKAFIDFSTSGLENPLNHLLFAWFGYVLVRMRAHPHFWFYCSLTVALSMLNRMDTVMLYAPILAFICLPSLRSVRWRQVLAGALPLLLWLGFSLFYYGFLFPNTKYAKLSTGIATLSYVKQGVLYFLELFSSDAFSYMILCVTIARTVDGLKDLLAVRLRGKIPEKDLPPYVLPVGLGAISYMLYVTFVGGDFMSGRFLTLPFFVTVWLIYASLTQLDRKRAAAGIAFLVILKWLSLSMAHDAAKRCMADHPDAIWAKESYCLKAGIADERAFYSPTRVWYDDGSFDSHRYMQDRSFWLAQQALLKPERVYLFGAIGMLGYYTPGTTIVDIHALTDPLLARLPIDNPDDWRIGHFRRSIPDGYIFSIRYNRLDQMDPLLAAYYAPLRLIVSGNLLDPERLKAIWDFNLGKYDHFKEEYLREQRDRDD